MPRKEKPFSTSERISSQCMDNESQACSYKSLDDDSRHFPVDCSRGASGPDSIQSRCSAQSNRSVRLKLASRARSLHGTLSNTYRDPLKRRRLTSSASLAAPRAVQSYNISMVFQGVVRAEELSKHLLNQKSANLQAMHGDRTNDQWLCEATWRAYTPTCNRANIVQRYISLQLSASPTPRWCKTAKVKGSQ